ncbi:hypothetical protein EGC86_18470 [Shewanella frigidimarina]|uniref:hypothetical protein n=1 Tax=Shewanella frigidimarina TaxID=56812 RepID=UPI000F4F1576|nr:hypothetical protein [Shewanella frigidimarina]RPA58883.1 hypothetical protein EGC86_18470 [Shewanella frigidimarina]
MNSAKKGKFVASKVLFKEECENLDHTLIKISEEKLRLALNEYEDTVQSRNSWLAPLGVLITLLTALATTDFKSALSLSKDTWYALYIAGSVISLFYFVKAVHKSLKCNTTLDGLILKIKNKK